MRILKRSTGVEVGHLHTLCTLFCIIHCPCTCLPPATAAASPRFFTLREGRAGVALAFCLTEWPRLLGAGGEEGRPIRLLHVSLSSLLADASIPSVYRPLRSRSAEVDVDAFD